MLSHRRILVAIAAFAVAGALPRSPVLAAERFGPLQVSGSLETQSLLRHPDVDRWSLVQQRNTLRLRFNLDIVKDGAGTLGVSLPGVRSASIFLLYRPVYDSAFDLRPGPRQDVFPYANGITSASMDAFPQSVIDSIRESNAGLNAFRELYLDLALESVPLSFRIGRQMVVWGETDNFRMLDRVNPLDLSWHLQQETWDNIRIPLWIAKALYRFGRIGPLGGSFLEAYWDLGDWVPAKQKFLPYPWSIPTEDSLVNPATCADPSRTLTCRHFGFTDGGVPFRRGDYDKNPIDNGQWGVRWVFDTPPGVQVGLHYFYSRFGGDDGSLPTFVRAVDQTGPTPFAATNNLIALGEGKLPAEVIYPYVHTVGLSANYSEDQYTRTVYRMETIYELGLPFSDLRKEQKITNPDCLATPPGPTCLLAPEVPSGLRGTTNSDMWNGMIAFDRPTWIRAINRRSTVFLTAQFFWHYMVSDPSRFLGGLGASDKVRRWEALVTLAASTLLAGGTDQPFVFLGLDPVNHYSMTVGWRNDYFVTNNLIVSVFQNYFLTPGFGGRIDEHWGLGGLLKKRDESGMRVTVQF